MTVTEEIIRAIESLPEIRKAEVLAFIRFLEIGLDAAQPDEQRFARALTRARAIAAERGISEQDIAEEVEAVRAVP